MLVKRVFVAGCYNASTIKSETSTDLSLFSPPLCQKYCLQKEIYLFAVQVKFYENAAFVEKKIIFYAHLIIIFSERELFFSSREIHVFAFLKVVFMTIKTN